MNKAVTIKELYLEIPDYLKDFFSLKTYPWELLPLIKEKVHELVNNIPPHYTLLKEGVIVGENTKISPFATIEAPCVIGSNVEIRPGAYLRGNVIVSDHCVVGNSSELKNSILLTKVQVPHYNYVGDSILGSYSHMGAGSICSNLKSDNKNVVIHGDEDFQTNLRKVGSFLGDHADIGCGSVLNPGTIIGSHTQVYPLTMLRGVYEGNSIVKSTKEIIHKK